MPVFRYFGIEARHNCASTVQNLVRRTVRYRRILELSCQAPIQAKLSHNQTLRHFSERRDEFDICLSGKPDSAHRELEGDTKYMGLSISDHRPSNRRRRLHSRCVFHRRKVTPAPHPLHFSLPRLALTVLTQVRWPERMSSCALKSCRSTRHQGFLLGVAV